MTLRAEKQMHVLYVTNEVTRGASAMANQVNWIEALGQHPRVKRVSVLANRVDSNLGLPHKVDLFELPNWKLAANLVLVRKALRVKPDLLFMAQKTTRLLPGCIIARWLVHRPVLVWHAQAGTRLRVMFLAWLAASRIVTASPSSLPKRWKKIQPIGHGIATDSFRPEETPARGTQGDLVAVGRISPVKGIDSMARMLSALQREVGLMPSLDLIGPGSPDAKKRLDRILIREGVVGQVRHLDAVSQEELAGRLPRYRVLLNFSSGALDKSVLEAMACGLPILTTNESTIECLPKKLVDYVAARKDDPVGQATLLARLLALSPNEARNLGRSLRLLAIEGHSVSTFWDRVFQVVDVRSAGSDVITS